MRGLLLAALSLLVAASVAGEDKPPSAAQLVKRMTHQTCAYPNLRYEPEVRVCAGDVFRSRSSDEFAPSYIVQSFDPWWVVAVYQDAAPIPESVEVAVRVNYGVRDSYWFQIERYGTLATGGMHRWITLSLGQGTQASRNWNEDVSAETLLSAMHAIRAGILRDRSGTPCSNRDWVWTLELRSDGTVKGRCVEADT